MKMKIPKNTVLEIKGPTLDALKLIRSEAINDMVPAAINVFFISKIWFPGIKTFLPAKEYSFMTPKK